MIDDDEFLLRFEDCTWPLDQFHHREHVKVAYLYLRQFPLAEAIDRIRDGLKRYQAAHQVPDAIDQGYHETMTQAWMRLVHFIMCEHSPAETADEFFDAHPELWQMKVLRFFYSRERIMSPEAKANFVEPDIISLPIPWSKIVP
jgi:hypothetical protein